MPFTLGDLILMELSLTMLMKDMDLSMQAGQQFMQIIGRIELAIQQISTAQQNGQPAAISAGPGPSGD